MFKRIIKLEVEIKKLKEHNEEKPIGEVYRYFRHNNYHHNIFKGWFKFNKFAIGDEVENSTKIQGEWIKNKNIMYYDSIYDKKRKEIEKRNSKIEIGGEK